ncbi:MAG: dienelactone hydrolase family protein [Acidimicrobiia bacterium]
MGEIVEFPSNGSSATGYLAVPPAGGRLPVVVIQEWWGLVPHIEDVCDRFADAGFVALAPDLYHGESTTEPDEAGKKLMSLNLAQAGKDMSGAVDKVAEVAGADAVGVVGFCMGGGLALVLAAQRPDKVKACVPFYGFIPWPDATPDWSALTAAVSGHYASEDEFFTPEKARELEATLRSAGKRAAFEIHEGVQHAFFNDTRPEVYDADASGRAWASTLTFLAEELG